MNLIGDSNVRKDFKKTTMMLHCLGTHKHVPGPFPFCSFLK